MNCGQALRLGFFDFLGIVIGLEAEPETGTSAEKPRQPDGSVSGNGPLAIANGGDSRFRDSDFLCQAILAYSHRNQEFFPKDFTGMDIGKFFHGVTPMVVAYFYTAGRTFVPDKADSPLVIDSDAPLSVAVTEELFQPVLWGNTEVVDPAGVVQHPQLAPRHCLDLARETAEKNALPDFLRLVVMERSDHSKNANA